MALRFYLQPLMASLFAVRDGLKDARAGKPAYFWALLTEPKHRRERLQEGWKSVGKIFFAALALDLVYQVLVLRGFRPVETVLVATALAIVPYVLFRGPVNRLARLVREGFRRRAA